MTGLNVNRLVKNWLQQFFFILCLCSMLVLAYRKILHMFSTGEGLLLQRDSLTTEGLQQVFATNLFGHYVLVSITLSAVVSSIMDIFFWIELNSQF